MSASPPTPDVSLRRKLVGPITEGNLERVIKPDIEKALERDPSLN
jgi:hypothetical protein